MPVLDPDAQLLSEIDEFLTESGMSPTTFGTKALKDPGFVFDMREKGKARSPSGRTASKIREFMALQRREALQQRAETHDGGRATTAA